MLFGTIITAVNGIFEIIFLYVFIGTFLFSILLFFISKKLETIFDKWETDKTIVASQV
jgi:hypothetical protein